MSTDEQLGPDTAGGASTVRDGSGPAAGSPAARTQRDASGGDASSTVRDGSAPSAVAPSSAAWTVRDDTGGRPAPQKADVHVRTPLPPSLAARYRVVHPITTPGAEADLVVVDASDGSERFVVKLYRYGHHIDQRVLEAIRRRREPLPHVAALREFGEAEGIEYEVIEYVSGGTLAEVMQRAGGPLPLEDVRDMVRQLARAVGALHELNVVHRDIKPDNIMIRSRSESATGVERHSLELVLADFGLSTLLAPDQSWRQASTSRTPAYAPPEAVTGRVGESWDWWSLGMVVLKAVTGTNPLESVDGHVATFALSQQDVDVSPVTDDRFRRLCAGLLTQNTRLRWGPDEVRQWLGGESPPIYREERPSTKAYTVERPFEYMGHEYTSPGDLAAAMVTSWRDFARLIGPGSSAYPMVTKWLREVSPTPDTAALLDHVDELRQPDARVAALAYGLRPDLAPVFRDIDLGDGGRALADTVLGGRATQEQLDAMRVLAAGEAMQEYPSLAPIGKRWSASRIEARSHAGRVSAESGVAVDDLGDELLAMTLLLATDPSAEARLGDRGGNKRGASGIAWFQSFPTSPGGLVARHLLAPAAAVQHRTKSIEAERARAEQRARARQDLARSLGRSRLSLDLLQGLSWSAAIVGAGLLVLSLRSVPSPDWAGTAESSLTSFRAGGFLFAYRDDLVRLTVVATLVSVSAITVARAGRSLEARTHLRLIRAVNVVGSAVLPPTWPVAIRRGLATAAEDAATASGRHGGGASRWWLRLAMWPPLVFLVWHSIPRLLADDDSQLSEIVLTMNRVAPEWWWTGEIWFEIWQSERIEPFLAAWQWPVLVQVLVMGCLAGFAFLLAVRTHRSRHALERVVLPLTVAAGLLVSIAVLPELLWTMLLMMPIIWLVRWVRSNLM